MPKANSLSDWLRSAGFKALFVALVLLFNISFSTLSSARAYAGTDSVEVTEFIDQEDERESVQETTEQSENTEVNGEESQAVTEEEELAETVELQSVEVTKDEIEIATVSDLTANLVCITRIGLDVHSFNVSTTTSQDEMWEAGTIYNNSSVAEYNELLPSEFLTGTNEVTVDNWDGGSFTWTLGSSEIAIDVSAPRCDSPTLPELIEDDPELSVIQGLIESETKYCLTLRKEIHSANVGPYTLFLPTNSAIAGLVSSPASPVNELAQLEGNPDEICALVLSHVVEGEFDSSDVPMSGVTLYSIDNDVDGLFAQTVGGSVYVDGVKVEESNLFASNGVIHKVGSVLLPQSIATINPVVTNQTSPALSGNISPVTLSGAEAKFEFCVLVRVNGIPHIADVDGLSWNIPAGQISINPTNEILFDVVVRAGYGYYTNESGQEFGCEEIETEVDRAASLRASAVEVQTHGSRLLGLTMRKNVVSFQAPVEEPEKPGEVLGESTDPVEITVVSEPVTIAPQACGKGVCGDVAQANDPSTTDSDGDGVVDSEDPAPFDPQITGLEDSEADEEDSATDPIEDDDGDSANALLWFLVGGGVVALWYLLWQRSGREV